MPEEEDKVWPRMPGIKHISDLPMPEDLIPNDPNKYVPPMDTSTIPVFTKITDKYDND